MATKHGLRLCKNDIELKIDGWRREKLPGRRSVIVKQPKRSTLRGKLAAWSKASARRQAFIAATVELLFASPLTLTNQMRKQMWGDSTRAEAADQRNAR